MKRAAFNIYLKHIWVTVTVLATSVSIAFLNLVEITFVQRQQLFNTILSNLITFEVTLFNENSSPFGNKAIKEQQQRL